jgi:glycosyltransferase involved in cell wall biosynthesis
MPRLKCLVTTGVLDAGGSDEVVAFLARHLPSYGVDAVVAHSGTVIPGATGGGRLPSILRQEGIRVVDVTEHSAPALLDEVCPDVISAHGAPDWWLQLSATRNIPYVDTLHGMHSFFNTDWSKEAKRSLYVTTYVAVSEMTRRQYLAGNPYLDPSRIVTIPNSVDPGRVPIIDRQCAREWLNLDNEFLFVSLSRHTLQKNTYALVQAFEEVAKRHSNVHLLISGRADDRLYAEQVRRLRDSLHCRDRVYLRDHSPFPAALLAAADGFVLNSYFEGWSLGSMEALFAGIPVVLSDVGGAREQVGDGEEYGYLVGNPVGDALQVNWETIRTSLYVRQPNHDELVGAMSRIVHEREYWAARRRKLQIDSARRFHPDNSLRRHALVVTEAARARPQPPGACADVARVV